MTEEDRPALRTALNVLWLVFSGLWLALLYAIAGVIACLLLVTFRWGLRSLRLALYMLWPMGRATNLHPEDPGPPWYDPRNLLWLLVGGIWVTVAHVILGLFFAATLFAALFAAEHLKMLPVVLRPLAYRVEREQYGPQRVDTPLPDEAPTRLFHPTNGN